MKRNHLVLMAIAFVWSIALFGCKKDDPTTVKPVLVSETKDIHSTYAEFEWSIEFPGMFETGVELSLHENMSDSTLYQGTQSNNTYKVTIENLLPNTKYYFRYVVWNSNRRDPFAVSSFMTEAGVPILTTDAPTAITQISAIIGGTITSDGGTVVTSSGVCWGTEPEPTIENSFAESDATTGHFTVEATGLMAETKYYARAYATNRKGTGYGNVVTFFTGNATPPVVSIIGITVNTSSVTVNCNVISDGGASVTTRGVCWSTEPNPEYTGHHQTEGNGTGEFTANLTGLNSETQYHVRAYAINSIDVAYSEDMTFTTSDAPQAPTGAINGVFSVSPTNKVWFSKGNLQYIGDATTPYWKFADNQWMVIGTSQGSAAPNVKRDLFGWGTSGYHDSGDSNNTNYQPYSTSTSSVNSTYNKYGYGPSTNQNNPNIAGTHYDWGVHNPIYNGGNWAGVWRTLTKNEWVYVLYTRQTSTVSGTPNARFAKGKVNDVYGMILFPDSYTHPSEVTAPFGINDTENTGWNYNSYSSTDWEKMEEKGCVFLPAAGYRSGTSVTQEGLSGHYWSASFQDTSDAHYMYFDKGHFYWSYNERYYGYSVRLVAPAE